MSRFVLTCVLSLLALSNINAQESITIDSLSVSGTTFLLEERSYDEDINDSVIITHLSSIEYPEMAIYIRCDAFDTSIAFDRTSFFCVFNYNGREYSKEMLHPTYDSETKSYVFRESHIFDHILNNVMPINGIKDYYYPILHIMESFHLKIEIACDRIHKKYIKDCMTVLYSGHPRKLIIWD